MFTATGYYIKDEKKVPFRKDFDTIGDIGRYIKNRCIGKSIIFPTESNYQIYWKESMDMFITFITNENDVYFSSGMYTDGVKHTSEPVKQMLNELMKWYLEPYKYVSRIKAKDGFAEIEYYDFTDEGNTEETTEE